ncbi:MAG: ABC transporter permease [Planctomycetota bacterium]|jgi:ABC-2 type transport system permease protein
MRRRINLVAWQEYLANVRTRTFWIGVLALPVIMIMAAGIGIALQRHTPPAKPFVVLLDGEHAAIRDALREAFDGPRGETLRTKYRWDAAEPDLTLDALQARILDGSLFAALVLPENLIEDASAVYYGRNLADRNLHGWLDRELQRLVRAARVAERNLDQVDVAYVTADFELQQKQIAASGETRAISDLDMIRIYSPLAFVYMLWIAMITVAQMLLNNVIEEKSSRVIEVLLSSVSPTELMAGKILGIALTGMTLFLTWIASMLGFVHWGVPMMGIGARSGELITQILSLFSLWNISLLLTYFVLGFLFLAAIFAAIGSVCTSIKESQNLLTPVIFVLAVPLMTMTFITENPHTMLGKTLSWFPPFTPFVMMNRAAAEPPAELWEVLASIGWLAIWTVIAFILAGRIFRVGVLMTGKAPTPRELWKMMWTR